jgi:hypothetical protein
VDGSTFPDGGSARHDAGRRLAAGKDAVIFFLRFYFFIFACSPHKHPHTKIAIFADLLM